MKSPDVHVPQKGPHKGHIVNVVARDMPITFPKRNQILTLPGCYAVCSCGESWEFTDDSPTKEADK